VDLFGSILLGLLSTYLVEDLVAKEIIRFNCFFVLGRNGGGELLQN
jgi:hypothetical protein